MTVQVLFCQFWLFDLRFHILFSPCLFRWGDLLVEEAGLLWSLGLQEGSVFSFGTWVEFSLYQIAEGSPISWGVLCVSVSLNEKGPKDPMDSVVSSHVCGNSKPHIQSEASGTPRAGSTRESVVPRLYFFLKEWDDCASWMTFSSHWWWAGNTVRAGPHHTAEEFKYRFRFHK